MGGVGCTLPKRTNVQTAAAFFAETLLGLVTVHRNHRMCHWGSFWVELIREENFDQNDYV